MKHQQWMRGLGRHFIPNIGTIIVIALMLWATQAGAAPWSAPGPSSTTVNYQGRLADSNGNALTGTYGMQFAIYNAATSGSLVWGPESHTAVPVSNGLFSVGLGSQTSGGIPTRVWDGDRYLEITIDGETMSPRELIRSVPIAGLALTVPTNSIGSSQLQDGSVSSAKLANGSVTSNKINLSSKYVGPTNFPVRITLDDNAQDILGTESSINTNETLTVIAVATFDFAIDDDTTAVGELVLNGVPLEAQVIQSGGRSTVAQVYRFTIDKNSSLKLQARKIGLGNATVLDHTKLIWFVVKS